jgi:chromosome segregation ATPase
MPQTAWEEDLDSAADRLARNRTLLRLAITIVVVLVGTVASILGRLYVVEDNRIGNLEEQVKEMGAAQTKLSTELGTQLQKAIDHDESAIGGLNYQIGDLEKQVKAINDGLAQERSGERQDSREGAALAAQQAAYQREIEELEEEVKDLEHTVNSLKDEINSLDRRS